MSGRDIVMFLHGKNYTVVIPSTGNAGPPTIYRIEHVECDTGAHFYRAYIDNVVSGPLSRLASENYTGLASGDEGTRKQFIGVLGYMTVLREEAVQKAIDYFNSTETGCELLFRVLPQIGNN